MTIEEELSRQLRSRAAGARFAPDLEDLTARVSERRRRAERRDRLVLAAAALIFVGSLGGLGGALASTHSKVTPYVPTGGVQGPNGQQLGSGAQASKRGGGTRGDRLRHSHLAPHEAPGPRSVFRASFASGVKVAASLQGLALPVAVAVAGGGRASCMPASVVTTAVQGSGSEALDTGVVGLPALPPTGLEVVDSGLLSPASGTSVWWLTAAVGSSVAQVAATGPGGVVVTVAPSSGIAVLAGRATAGGSTSAQLSAVAEDPSGRSFGSIGVQIGSGPKVVGGGASTLGAARASTKAKSARSTSAPCQVLAAPQQVPPGGAPASPQLTAAAVMAAFEQAYSPSGLGALGAAYAGVSLAPAPQPAAVAPVSFEEVAFDSSTRAEVAYRLGRGLWHSGEAVISSGGRWRVGTTTLCRDIASGSVPARSPAGLLTVTDCAAKA